MKRFQAFLFAIMICLGMQHLQANPLPAPLFSELKLTSDGFVLEVTGIFQNFDNCYLTTLTDTAYFKPGIRGDIDFQLITEDSLLSPLFINPEGDELSFHWHDSLLYERIIFGDSGNCQISAPLPAQSISLYIGGMFFYLDNTPTLGGPNDLLNAAGTVEGYVTNQFGQPLSGVRISFEHFWDYAYTDTNGYFSFTKLACLEELTFEKTGYPTGYLTVQVWPESTLTLNVNWGELTGIQFEPSTSPISMYELSQNYPNPFNPITTIEFTLPLQSEVTLTIYNPLGEVVETLVSDRLRAGRYSLKWNASQYPSGIYFYRLEASSAEGAKSHRFTQSKKLILLK